MTFGLSKKELEELEEHKSALNAAYATWKKAVERYNKRVAEIRHLEDEIMALRNKLVEAAKIVHILSAGFALCRQGNDKISPGATFPDAWPPGHNWVRRGEEGATCAMCIAIAKASP